MGVNVGAYVSVLVNDVTVLVIEVAVVGAVGAGVSSSSSGGSCKFSTF